MKKKGGEPVMGRVTFWGREKRQVVCCHGEKKGRGASEGDNANAYTTKKLKERQGEKKKTTSLLSRLDSRRERGKRAHQQRKERKRLHFLAPLRFSPILGLGGGVNVYWKGEKGERGKKTLPPYF